MPPEITWTALPRSIDVTKRRIGLSVVVAPQLTGSLSGDLRAWPDFIHSHENDFTFLFNGTASFSAKLIWQVPRSESAALWCRFFEGQPVRPNRKFIPAAITTNSAGKVSALIKDAKTNLFGTVSDKLIEHFDTRTVDSLRKVAVARQEIPHKLQPLASVWRGAESLVEGKTDEDSTPRMSPGEFDAWLHGIHNVKVRAVIERNLFRMADRPYEDLTAKGLGLFHKAMKEMYKLNEDFIGMSSLPEPMYSSSSDEPKTHHVLHMLAFHRRVRNDMRTRSAQTAALKLPNQKFEFHERVALLSGRPAILRAVDLILDFEIDYDGRANELRTEFGTVEVKPPTVSDGHAAIPPSTPPVRTRYRFRDSGQPRFETTGGVTVVDGYRKIGNGDYTLESIDADGAAFKAVQSLSAGVQSEAGRQFKMEPDASKADTEAPYTIPADRTTGISLIHHERANELQSLLYPQAPLPSHVLNSDEAAAGYIVEIKSDIKGCTDFMSQMKRTEKHLYAAAGEPDSCLRLFDAGDQEGVTRLSVAKATDGTSSGAPPADDLHASETIVRWDGWSLAAPRFFGGEPIPAEQPPDDQRPLPWTLKSVYRAKAGSLTPLRFGHRYWLRLKAVDVAGNPMTQSEPQKPADVTLGDAHGGGFEYRRYEPIPHPVVMLTSTIDHVRHPGESLRRMVLTKPVHQFADESVERCVIPPVATFRTAEQHGMFDLDVRPDSKTGFDDIGLIAQCDACGNPGWRFEETADKDPLWIPPHDGSKDHGPYWPDPMAGSLCVKIEDLVSGELIELDPYAFYGREHAWPKAHRIMLRIQHRAEGSARIRTEWRHDPATLVVDLPPSWVARVLISSGIPADRTGHMAHFAAWKEALTFAMPDHIPNCPPPSILKKIEAIHHAVVCGCHPMISPCEEVIVVHPVERPLRAPVIDEIRVLPRPRADVMAQFEIDMHVDRKSTGRIDLEASWKEFDDLKSTPSPQTNPATTHVADWYIETPEKARDYDPLALSAFTPMKPVKAGEDPAIQPVVHQFHDTKFREITYKLSGTTRFKQEFPAGGDPRRFSVDSADYVVSIPSSAPPKTPDVLYIMPSFEWTSEVAPTLEPGARIYSRRAGGGLRIYMDRGWYSSGAGERLGVVLWPSMSTAQCERLNEGKDVSFRIEREFPAGAEMLSKYVTRWGLDPIWHRTPMPDLPTPHHFHAPKGQRIVYGCKLRLQECANVSNCDSSAIEVSVVSYEPQYDPQLQRWYCDLQVHPVPSYNTFIRLALVRYQPNAIDGAEVSTVVLADFVQLVPDRAVSVTRVPYERRTVALQIFGPRNEGNQFEVTVELPCGDLVGELAWMRDQCIVPEDVPGSAEALASMHITFPQGCGPRRIVVRETERHFADAGPIAPSCEKPQPVAERDPVKPPRTVKRIVYADVIEI
jgi:hypothetical protein